MISQLLNWCWLFGLQCHFQPEFTILLSNYFSKNGRRLSKIETAKFFERLSNDFREIQSPSQETENCCTLLDFGTGNSREIHVKQFWKPEYWFLDCILPCIARFNKYRVESANSSAEFLTRDFPLRFSFWTGFQFSS